MDTRAIPSPPTAILCLSFQKFYGNKNVMNSMIELSSFFLKKDSYTCTSISKKMNLDVNFIPYTKMYSEWIMNLNVKQKIVEFFKKIF